MIIEASPLLIGNFCLTQSLWILHALVNEFSRVLSSEMCTSILANVAFIALM